jgi:hypothetical protein
VLFVVARHLFHVKCFEFSWEPIQEYRFSNDVRHLPLSSFGDIIPYLMVNHFDLAMLILYRISISILFGVLNAMLVKPFNGINIGESQEWPRGFLKLGVKLSDKGSGGRVAEEYVYGFADLEEPDIAIHITMNRKRTYDIFDVVHKILKCDECKLSL